MDYLIRYATNADAPEISRTIVNTLRQSNAQDYSSEIIDQVAQNFSPVAILCLLTERQVLVATANSHIVATASLDQNVVRSVFVDPSHQGKGIGRLLIERLQTMAKNAGLNLILVSSSITAEGFYVSLGFKKIRDEFHGSERTIIMAKTVGL
ncbi:GNAT family N-acetyltransferase [Pseudomonas corrugata]|uniref:GNAT family N-acetyltransferase n=1 Tax=Pseudomonas corrugata TaxID=47879 RepID=A0A8B6UR79_9PSED|nr:GNAT family N-acetyltransferase [Pseudomonas corrugata]QTH14406.1 GNAT family N-acetyltransferase [Pseudomonas corrugata]UZD95506.1 GNAT family N-acetyltransferase [Pseudomonas corrugata]